MKRGHHHGELRKALIAAGLELLDAEGIEGVTIRACARRAGVSHAAPANHFPDHRALLTALAVHCMDALHGETELRLGAVGGTARQRLEALFDLTVRHGEAWPHRYRLMGRADLRDADDPALVEAQQRLLSHVIGIAIELDPQQVSARTLAISLCAALSGHVFMRIDGNLAMQLDDRSGRPLHLALLDLLLD